jgi:hypothetical protein
MIRFLKTLLSERELYSGEYDLTWKMIQCHEIDILRPGDGSRVSFDWASVKIDEVKAIPRPKPANGERQHYGRKQPAAAHEQRYNSEPAACGVYKRVDKSGERIYVVRQFKPQGESEHVRYAREIVELRDSQGDRVNAHGEAVRIEEIKAPKMQWSLRADEAMPMADVLALSLQWSNCLICGKSIRVKKSIDRGIGPVCYGRQSELLGLSEPVSA